MKLSPLRFRFEKGNRVAEVCLNGNRVTIYVIFDGGILMDRRVSVSHDNETALALFEALLSLHLEEGYSLICETSGK